MPVCDGKIQNITFNSVNNVSSSATITIGKGENCDSSIMYEQQISSFSNGNNTVILNNPIKVTKNEYYFFNVRTNDGSNWRVRFNPTSQVKGRLATYNSSSSNLLCDKEYVNNDWKFSVDINESEDNTTTDPIAECIISSTGSKVSTISKKSWGQSFLAECNGKIQMITFNSASNVSSSSTLSIYEGEDCKSSVIHSQTISNIANGDNTISMDSPVKIQEGQNYFFQVISNEEKLWKVRHSIGNQVPGNLKTYYKNKLITSCSKKVADYDWKFSVSLSDSEDNDPVDPQGNTDIDLFIWAGQSNALGRKGDGAQYPSDPSHLDSKIKLNYEIIHFSNSDGWISMQTQKGYFPDGHFGPEVTFSRKLKAAGFKPAIFKYTRGSSSIYENWKRPGRNGYYDKMIENLRKAIKKLENQGYKVTIKGFIWIQGESDGENEIYASAYYSNLKSIINDIRQNVAHNSKLPIILGVDEQHVFVVNQPEVLNAQKRIANNDSNTKFTSMIGLPKADGTHLTPIGLEQHGEIIFHALLNLNNNPAPDPNDLGTGTDCLISSSGSTVSTISKKSWGQSFEAECNGNIQLITFNSASNVSSSSTISIYEGEDCKSSVIHSQTISNIANGDNTISMDSPVKIQEGQNYFFQVISNEEKLWKVRHSIGNQVPGNLKTYYKNKLITSCSKKVADYDWKFAVKVKPESTAFKFSLSSSKLDNDFIISDDVNIYPNPSNGRLSIETALPLVHIELFTVYGQKIEEFQINKKDFSIDHVNPGVYFLQIKTENKTMMKRIIKN